MILVLASQHLLHSVEESNDNKELKGKNEKKNAIDIDCDKIILRGLAVFGAFKHIINLGADLSLSEGLSSFTEFLKATNLSLRRVFIDFYAI